jgi:UDP:flavonoid glycosyltransferase YjiC (YdhE family)
MAVPYAPHGAAFPHAAVLVHQGGIGTTAQALRSGKPQLVVPFAHDQFDNAARVRRLGVAEVLQRSHYRPHRIAQLLRQLLEESSYASAGTCISERIRTENGCESAADIIERTVRN